MAFKIAFFDTKPYDRASFDEVNEKLIIRLCTCYIRNY